MRLRVGPTGYRGRVVDLRARDVDGRVVAGAVRGDRPYPLLDCPSPPSVYEYAGHVHSEMGLRVRTALATAARSAGHETTHDGALEKLRAELASVDPAEPSLPSLPDEPDAGAVEELREMVAMHRGRVRAREALDGDASDARTELRDVAAALAERETERTAASQARERRRERAREYRDAVEKRRRLADRLGNRERAARRELVDAVVEEYADAVAAAPGPTPAEPFDADAVTAALAVLRVARTPAPVVVGVDRFADPATAAEWLGAPVVRC